MKGLGKGHRVIPFPSVVSGFFRVVTDRRITAAPASPEEALDFMDQLLTSTLVTIGESGPRIWQILRTMISR